jgi:hypothetical protein
VCDGVDNDCDADVDEDQPAVPAICYPVADGLPRQNSAFWRADSPPPMRARGSAVGRNRSVYDRNAQWWVRLRRDGAPGAERRPDRVPDVLTEHRVSERGKYG